MTEGGDPDMNEQINRMLELGGQAEGSARVRAVAREVAAFHRELMDSGMEWEDAIRLAGDLVWMRLGDEEPGA